MPLPIQIPKAFEKLFHLILDSLSSYGLPVSLISWSFSFSLAIFLQWKTDHMISLARVFQDFTLYYRSFLY